MMFLRKKAQSILEYSILIAIVIAAVVVMQVYMKRGISGRLKESSDKISGGESFSASGTTTKETSNMTAPRDITDMSGTDNNSAAVAGLVIYPNASDIQDLKSRNIYSAGGSQGGDTTSNSSSRTLDASNEAFSANNLTSTGSITDFQTGGTGGAE